MRDLQSRRTPPKPSSSQRPCGFPRFWTCRGFARSGVRGCPGESSAATGAKTSRRHVAIGRLADPRRISALSRCADALNGARAGGRGVAGLLPSLPTPCIRAAEAAPHRSCATRGIASAPCHGADVRRQADSCWSLVSTSSPTGEDGPGRTKFCQGPMRLGPFRLPSIRGLPSCSGPLVGSGTRNSTRNQRR